MSSPSSLQRLQYGIGGITINVVNCNRSSASASSSTSNEKLESQIDQTVRIASVDFRVSL
jgi:hypothetical protein